MDLVCSRPFAHGLQVFLSKLLSGLLGGKNQIYSVFNQNKAECLGSWVSSGRDPGTCTHLARRYPETKLWRVCVEGCLRLGVAQMTPCMQPALVALYSSHPLKIIPGGGVGLLWSIFNVSILTAPGYVRSLFRVVG